MAYLPALDGLRAMAVIVVVLYHAGLRWLPGGFLGVEIFFVISGYLITTLLLTEWGHNGRIDFKAFWLRRARRLLPALFLLLLATLTFAVLFLHEEVAGLRTDALASTGYVTNWYLIFSHKSYFETVGRPSLLRHLWSLAVEEQFYLLWPLLFAAAIRWLRPRKALIAIIAGAVASTVLMVVLFNPDVDPSRVYYGTDTRAAGLLLGAALAFVWSPGQKRELPGKLPVGVVGAAGLAILLAACVVITEYTSFLYQGGFLLVTLATLAVILAAVAPKPSRVQRALGWGPLRWIGLRSYGIYLWHWPVFMVTRPQIDVPLTGLPLFGLRITLTLILVELSYRLVEMPVRSGGLGRAWRTWHEAHGARRRSLGMRWASAAATFGLSFILLGQSVVRAQPPPPPAYLAVDSIRISSSAMGKPGGSAARGAGQVGVEPQQVGPQPPAPFSVFPSLMLGGTSSDPASTSVASVSWSGQTAASMTVRPQASTLNRPLTSPKSVFENMDPSGPGRLVYGSAGAGVYATPTATPTAMPTPTAIPVPTATPTLPPPPPDTPAPADSPAPSDGALVSAIGDSVMIGAAKAMAADIPNLDVDAKVGRQASAALELLRVRLAADQLGSVVILQIGNNGTFTARQFDEVMSLLAGSRRVVLVNLKVPRQWEASNNAMLAENVKRYPNAVLVDWQGVSNNHPEFFWGDGIHLRPEGAKAYADMIAVAVQAP